VEHRDVPNGPAKLTVYSFDSPGNNSAPAFRNVTISNFSQPQAAGHG